jgi:putative membrane protein
VSPRLTQEEGWQRLHPLSPVTRIGRLGPAVVIWFVLSSHRSQGGKDSAEIYYVVGITVFLAILGVVHWLVTRWRIDGDTLRIETGLIRRDSRQLPLARIQAVDIVRPFFARVLGLSELRMRLAGSGSTDGKLAYLTDLEARELRAFLLAGHQGLTPEAAGTTTRPMAVVGTGRLAASIALSGMSVFLFCAVVTLLIVSDLTPRAGAKIAGILFIYLLSIGSALWRRLAGAYHFDASEAPEGVRIRRGLLQTVSETIPHGRIQAVRRIEPLLWRPFGWCRLEVDIAGAGSRNQRGEGSSVARKALLPVGTHQDAWHLVSRLLGGPAPALTRPPRQARVKAPLSYHFLSAGHDTTHAVCVTGRLRKVTAWVPLEKSQSIRRVQGPLQRLLGLASVHVDSAGRRARAEFRDRSVAEADLLVGELTELSRAARLLLGAAAVGPSPEEGAPPPGWYPDPTGRHQSRYWDEGQWTDHVGNGGATALDRLS